MFMGSFELELTEQCEGKSIKPHPQPNSVFAQFSVLCMFNWMLGQLRKAVGRSFLEERSYFRRRAPNLNRLSNVRENAINSHSQPNSVFAQFSILYMFNWVFGRLRKAVGRSFLEERSYVRGKAPNLNRLSSVRENTINPHSQPNSVFAHSPVVCMFNWMLGQLRKAVGRSFLEGRSCLEGGSYVRGRALNLNRLSSAKERK